MLSPRGCACRERMLTLVPAAASGRDGDGEEHVLSLQCYGQASHMVRAGFPSCRG